MHKKDVSERLGLLEQHIIPAFAPSLFVKQPVKTRSAPAGK
jgi:hypothetical protein